MPPAEAVICTVPSAPAVAVGVTTPAETVAICVLLDVHVETDVMSIEPLQVWAVALMETLVVPPLVIEALVGLSVIDVMQPTITVND